MGTWINFQEIRERVSLEDVLLKFYQLSTLRREGRKLIGACPVHGGDSPRAFHADLDKNGWFCFSRCRAGGNQIDFVAKREGVSVREAALKLHEFFLAPVSPPRGAPPPPRAAAQPASAPPPASSRPAAPPPPVPPVRSADILPFPATAPATAATPTSTPSVDADGSKDEHERPNRPLELRLALAHDHPHLLKDRGLMQATVESFGIGYCRGGTLRGTIAIPIHDEDGDLVAYAGRRLKPSDIREFGKYKFPKGFRKDLVLYNLHRASQYGHERGLILVEGFYSVVKLAELDYPNVVASMGCSLSEAQAQLLAAHASEVVILYDGDDAGWAGATAARELLGERLRVRVVRLPVGAQPDTLPKRALRWAISGAQELDLAELSFQPRPAPPTTT
jgi:DNA primase